MSKCCDKCLYYPERDGKRACSWFAASQIGRNIFRIGPQWVRHAVSQAHHTVPSYGADCPAYEPSE